MGEGEPTSGSRLDVRSRRRERGVLEGPALVRGGRRGGRQGGCRRHERNNDKIVPTASDTGRNQTRIGAHHEGLALLLRPP